MKKKKTKKIYNIPIIIESLFGGNKYSFKTKKKLYNLKLDVIYEASYKLIKFCSEEVWNKIMNN